MTVYFHFIISLYGKSVEMGFNIECSRYISAYTDTIVHVICSPIDVYIQLGWYKNPYYFGLVSLVQVQAMLDVPLHSRV